MNQSQVSQSTPQDQQAELHRLQEDLRARNEQLLDLLNEYTERSLQLVSAYQAIAKQNEEILNVQQVYQSTSWRITAPMRAVSLAIQALRRRLRQASHAYRSGQGLTAALGALTRLPGSAGHAAPGRRPDQPLRDYQTWIRLHDTPDSAALQRLQAMAEQLPQVRVSVIMPTYNANLKWLGDAIDSVQQQIYPHWELCICDDASTDPAVRPFLRERAAADPRIRLVFRDENGHISAATNSALEVATGDWITFVDHDDLIPAHALLYMVHAAHEHPDAMMMYSDEDKVDEQGVRYGAYFKTDWNPDLFYGHNLVTHLAFYRHELIRKVGGLRDEYAGAQDYDLVLRVIEHIRADQIVHVPFILYHWRSHAGSTATADLNIKPYAMLAGERALNDHFRRINNGARAQFVGHGYRTRYRLPAQPPLASIIIPTRNAKELVKTCIESILGKTRYSNYEILLIDNGSDDAEALACFAELGQRKNVRVIRDDSPFSFSAINNRAANHAKGEVLVFLNNDIEVINPEWLEELISHACRPGIGAVGARLLYPNGTLQHAGILLGIGGWAGHAHKGFSALHNGYAGRATLINNFSAVTGACMAVRREHFFKVGGFDEQHLKIACNDVDLCLKLSELGLRNVYTPFASLYHHESATRGYEDTPEKAARFRSEVAYMWKRWPQQMKSDPAYSPYLTLDAEDFSLAWPPRVEHLWADRSKPAELKPA